MLSYNNNCLDSDYSESLTYNREKLNDRFIDYKTLDRVWFPKEFKLDEHKKRYIERDLCDL